MGFRRIPLGCSLTRGRISSSVDSLSQWQILMQDESSKKSESGSSTHLDLDALGGLSLGPQWSTDSAQEKKRYAEYEERPDRRRRGPGGPRGDRREGRPGGDRPRGGDRDERGPRDRTGRRDRRGPMPRGERETFFRPSVAVQFFPHEVPLQRLVEAMKASLRTFELFEVTRLFLEKPERLMVSVSPFPDAPTERSKLYLSVPDGLPFITEEEARRHVFSNHMEKFFTLETVEVAPPKGAFQVIHRCGVTGTLLGPPNYHRYQSLLQEHYASNISNMSYDRFVSRLESVREEEQIQAWIQQMTQQTRYRLKPEFGAADTVMDTMESARFHLITHHRNEVVKEVANARFEGRFLEQLPRGSSIRQSIETVLEQQQRFPLDTANHLRGRLRRLNFTLYKKGSKGVSYVCAVKRQFRAPGQVFADSVQRLLDFLEARPDFPAAKLPKEFLGIEPKEPVSPKAAVPAPPEKAPEETEAPAPESLATEETELPESTAEEPKAEATTPAPTDSPEKAEKPKATHTAEETVRLNQLRVDLRWLVSEGYVIEYSDGRLLVTPVLDPPKEKKPDSPAVKKQPAPTVDEPEEEEKPSEEPAPTAELTSDQPENVESDSVAPEKADTVTPPSEEARSEEATPETPVKQPEAPEASEGSEAPESEKR